MIKKTSWIKQTKIVLENLYWIDCVETRENIQKLLVKIIEWRILIVTNSSPNGIYEEGAKGDG